MAKQQIFGLGYLIHDVARKLKRQFAENARRQGLTLPQWRAMRQLKEADGLSQVALASLIESDPMTVSRMVERMETAGLVERVADPQDSRAKLVRLTAKSHAFYDHLSQVALAVYDAALDGLSEDERAALVRSLERISANLGAVPQEADAADVEEECQ